MSEWMQYTLVICGGIITILTLWNMVEQRIKSTRMPTDNLEERVSLLEKKLEFEIKATFVEYDARFGRDKQKIESIEEMLSMSRATLLNDLKSVKERLDDIGARFSENKHFGLSIDYPEIQKRDMIFYIFQEMCDERKVLFSEVSCNPAVNFARKLLKIDRYYHLASKAISKAEKKTTTTTKKQSETATTTAAADPNAKSPNVQFYQDRAVIAGDSIAYGFCAYGYVPYDHNIAKGSTALRQYDDTSLFMFDPTGTPLSFLDAIAAVKPSLLYISMGMNDVNLIDDQTYVTRYKDLINKVKQRVPDCIIVCCSITPITAASQFTDINNIRTFNATLKTTIEGLKDENVLFFDAYSVIVGPDGIYSPQENSAGDGVHLAAGCYQQLLDKLAVLLDSKGMKDKITQIEANRKNA